MWQGGEGRWQPGESPFLTTTKRVCPQSRATSTHRRPVLTSPAALACGNRLIAVWPEHPKPGAKGNQSRAPARPQGRGLCCSQGREREEMRTMSTLAPANL